MPFWDYVMRDEERSEWKIHYMFLMWGATKVTGGWNLNHVSSLQYFAATDANHMVGFVLCQKNTQGKFYLHICESDIFLIKNYVWVGEISNANSEYESTWGICKLGHYSKPGAQKQEWNGPKLEKKNS